MTERIYYEDSTLHAFTAELVEHRKTDLGPAVRLDRTAFYPTSGGQPHDVGTIAGVPVVDVWEEESGEIWHRLASSEALPEGFAPGAQIEGHIDRTRRFDHMQQHTGQHLLSALFIELLDAPTLSFHLGSDASTIDLELLHLSWEAAFRVEDRANRLVWEDRPVQVEVVAPERVAEFKLRKPPQVSGDVRIVSIAGCDASACGGTHVTSTGQVGAVKITGIERYKGGVRVSFLCGGRALRDYRRALELLQQVAVDLTVAQDEVPEAVARIREEAKETRRALGDVRERLNLFEAERLWLAAPKSAGIRRLVSYLPEHDFDAVRAIATHLIEHPHTLIMLAVSEEKGVRAVCARSSDLPQVDASALLRTALAPLDGRGGGSPVLAQGGAPLHSRDEILAAFEGALNDIELETNGG